jgi:hypothetical protein
MNTNAPNTQARIVTLGEFMQMSSGERAIAIEQGANLLKSYEDRGQKPPTDLVWGHYELLDAFG